VTRTDVLHSSVPQVQQIWPDRAATGNGEIDPATDLAAAVAGEARPPHADRPWVMLNMIASVDGASADVEGRSGLLGGPGDRELFQVLRATADAIVAGAGTVRTENYGAPRLSPDRQAARKARGQCPLPWLAVASASLQLDPAARLFREAPSDQPPLVLTTEASLASEPSATAGRALADVARLRPAGAELVDWEVALRLLHDEVGARVVLVEGGPNVNGQLAAHGLVDELCLTVSPVLMGGLTARIVADLSEMPAQPLRLDRIFVDEDFLFLRYTRVS